MLDKINGVNLNSEYSNTGKPAVSGGFSGVYSRKLDSHDSIKISPAMIYLNQINWRLKEFKHTSNDKIFISFVVSQIEFKTSIEINNLDSLSGLNYSVSKHGEGIGKRSEATGDLYVRLDKISYTEEPRLINFSALNIFFQRIFSLNLHTELTRNDSKVINDLMDGISGGIKNEFDYLNNYLFIFLDKLNGIRTSRKELPPAGEDNAVVIKKIKMLHAE